VPKKAPSLVAPTMASLVASLTWKASEIPSMAPPISPRSYLCCVWVCFSCVCKEEGKEVGGQLVLC
jgi:hypothetical protein